MLLKMSVLSVLFMKLSLFICSQNNILRRRSHDIIPLVGSFVCSHALPCLNGQIFRKLHKNITNRPGIMYKVRKHDYH